MTDDPPTYHDADPQDLIAARVASKILRVYADTASEITQAWRDEGKPVAGSDWWWLVLIMHAIEAARVNAPGGRLSEGASLAVQELVMHASAGTPLFQLSERNWGRMQ